MFQLQFTYSAAWLLPVLAAAGALTWWQYRRTRVSLSPAWRWLLVSFRFVAYSLLLVLLLGPLVTSLLEEREPPIVAFALDNSASLRANTDSLRLQRWPADISRLAKSLEAKGARVAFWEVGSAVSATESPDSFLFSDDGTPLADALQRPHDAYANQHLAAIVLASDGIPTVGNSPISVASDMRVPVFTYLLGDSTPRRDLAITETVHNEIAYRNSETPLLIRVKSQALEAQTVPITVSGLSGVLAKASVRLSERNGFYAEAQVYLKLTEPGLQRIRVTVPTSAADANPRNNRQDFYINVLDNRQRIGVFAGGPHPDLGAISQALGGTDRYEVRKYIRTGTTTWLSAPTTADYAALDAVILHNFPSSASDRPAVDQLLAAAKERNLPIWVLAGEQTLTSELARMKDYIPLVPSNLRGVDDALMYFAPTYLNHATAAAEDPAEFVAYLEGCPPLKRPAGEWAAQAGSQVLGKAKIKGVELDYPMLAFRSQEGHRSVILTAEGIWRYRVQNYRDREDFVAFDGWLERTLQWLTVRADRRPFRVAPTQPLFTGNSPVRFRGQVYDEAYNPLPGAEIELSVRDSSGKEFDFYLEEAAAGAYQATLQNLAEGTYRYTATGTRDGTTLGTDQGQFSVGASAREFTRLQADAELMRQLALLSGGQFFADPNLAALQDSLLALPTFKPLVNYRRATRGLHQLLWPLLVALGLLSAEWILRKRLGLV